MKQLNPVLIVTDHPYLYGQVKGVIDSEHATVKADYRSTMGDFLPRIAISEQLAKTYPLIISVHCRAIFPAALTRRALCINLHPGFNPHNRGWFPHVFSMVNGLPAGATLHVMDEKIDHGHVIAQEQVEIRSTDTSAEVYERIMEAEVRLFRAYLPSILTNTFTTHDVSEGNYNSKTAFETLRKIDMDESCTYGQAINRLRALTHGAHRNAYFVDKDGTRVFVRVTLEREAV